jgi:diguanylate cyclase (GGDEF)-like protein
MTLPLNFVLVEDSDDDQEIVARQLANAGLNCVIHRVETERDFIDALKGVRPDLIISDFSLPQFDGRRALDIALAEAPSTPFIYVSGTLGEEKAVEALKRGATDYVLKTNLSRLPSSVERALQEAELKLERAHAQEQRRDQELRLQRLTRTYRMLSSTTSAILRVRTRAELLDDVCRIAIRQGGYERAILRVIDSGKQIIRDRAHGTVNPRILRGTDFVATHANPSMAERSIREGSPVVDNDLAADRTSQENYKTLLAHGYRAAAALPLVIDGTTVGVLTLFSSQRNIFDGAEVGVLLELTANLSFALQYLEKDEAVRFLSHFDRLTGLANRKLFCERLEQFLAKDGANGVGQTVVVFDVQKLGAINDSFGRDVGDRLIEKIAARLKETSPNSECAAYFGGGTFAMTLASAAITRDTERLQQSAAAQLFVEPFNIDGQELRPAIRSGVALFPHDAHRAETLVQNAEAALSAAREDNEKCVLYGFVTQRPTSRSLALETRLTGALDRQEFLLHYQPKVNIESGRIEGFEALLRWQDSEQGMVPPAIFIPLLERSGAIVDVGEWVLLEAARDIRTWTMAGVAAIRVAVNVSPLQLRRRDFVERFISLLTPPGRKQVAMDIEITESMLMQDLELSVRKLAQLREAGVGVAIDDFGTGYSSLRLLAKLPVDTLKVDRSFVQGIADTANVLTLVSTIISLARAFNMRTVAEGVETKQQLKMLRHIKCDQAQGFLFGRPIQASEVPSAITRLLHPG